MRVLIFVIIWALAQVQGKGQETPAFQLQAEEHGVKVYTRPESNDDMSVRVTTTARTKVSLVLATLDAATDYPEWVHRCREAYVLPDGTPSEYTYYSRVKMPFPFQDREVVAVIRQRIDPISGILTRSISATPDAVPLTKGCVRLSTYEAEWIVAPTEDTELVSISCTVRTSAGSGLPNWLRREIMTGGPVKTVRNLVERVR